MKNKHFDTLQEYVCQLTGQMFIVYQRCKFLNESNQNLEATIENIQSEYGNQYELELEAGRLKKKIAELKQLLATYQSSHELGPEIFEMIKDAIVTQEQNKKRGASRGDSRISRQDDVKTAKRG